MIVGTVVSGLVLGTASVLTDVPGIRAPEATNLEVPAGSEFNQSREDQATSLPKVQASPDSPRAPVMEAPLPDDLSSIDDGATVSAAQPETGLDDLALNTPSAGDAAGGVAVDSDSPVLPSPQALAPQAPQSEDDLSISTEPAQPLLPEMIEQSAFPDPPEEPQGGHAEMMGGEDTDAGNPAIQTEPEPLKSAPATVPDTPETQAPDGTAIDDAAALVPQTSSVSAVGGQTEAGDGAENLGGDSAGPVDSMIVDTPSMPEVPTGEGDSERATDAPQKASGVIEDLAVEVTTNRLPSVSSTPDTTQDVDTVALPVGDDMDDTLPPLKRFAVEFENPENKPVMAIVLIDDGNSPIGLDALQSFPYPLSFAVDAAWPGAGDAMRKYRAAGFEVLAMVDLPADASATDAEVAMQAYLSRVPQAVAVMEGEGSGLQSSREASAQVASILLDSGHGAVLFPNGLNTAQKLIAREGVPSASVFRDFDAKGQNATVIRRFLDQAAFRAGQEAGGVIMVGRLRADTISALLLWGLQDRASRVALAPVSAVLSTE